MKIKIFVISLYDNGVALEEMNRFLQGNKVINVKEELVSNGQGSGVWTYSVQYLERRAASEKDGNTKAKIDYRKELDEATFIKYAKLRDCRKKLGEETSLPLYVIFTNAELAKIAGLEEMTLEQMGEIEGVGKSKLSKYGSRILELYKNMP